MLNQLVSEEIALEELQFISNELNLHSKRSNRLHGAVRSHKKKK